MLRRAFVTSRLDPTPDRTYHPALRSVSQRGGIPPRRGPRAAVGTLAATAVALALFSGLLVPTFSATAAPPGALPAPLGAGVTAAVVPAAAAGSPLHVIASLPVGGEPEFATFDTATGNLYVPNWGNNNVSVIHGTQVVGTVVVGSIPFSATYDPSNGFVYVVNEGSNNLSVINGTTVVASIPVGSTPQFASYDSFSERLYVSNSGSANVSVVNGTSVVATIPVGTQPSRVVIGGASAGGGGGWSPTPGVAGPVIYVPNTGSNNVTIVGGLGGTSILGSVHVGSGPQFGTWDPANAWLYVPNFNSNNVSVLTSVSPFRVLATVAVGASPFSASFVASTGQVLVVNNGAATVSVIGGLNTETVVATVHVGSGPEFVAQDGAPVNELLVPNTGSSNVTVLGGGKAIASLPAGAAPIYATIDPTNGWVYVQNFAGTNLTVYAPTLSVTFKAHGLPAGTPWNVTTVAPAALLTNVTVGTLGTVVAHVLPGPLAFRVQGPAGYGLAKVVGAGVVNQSFANVAAPTTISVTFGPFETLFFNESNLSKFQAYAGAPWNVSITPTLAHGGPAAQFAATNGTSLQFTVPAGGSYKFLVGGPGSEYKVPAPKGGVHIPAHALTHTVKFVLLTSVVVFKESGLASGTAWTVSITNGSSPARIYPFNTTATTASIVVRLPSGSYNWSVSSAGKTPGTASGAIVVVVPSPSTTVLTGTWT